MKGVDLVKRILEPELMEGEVQALAYARADFADSNSNFVRHFIELAGRDFAGAVLDLGCGPGDIPLRLARVYPRMIVHALDGSAAMLRLAREAATLAPEAAARVEWVQGLVPGAALPCARYDAVVSNSLLHHLPDSGALWDTVRGYAAPGAPVVVMDLFRPASAEAALAIVDRYAAGEDQILRHDFLASLHASFEPGEIQGQLAAAKLDGLNVQVVSDRHVLVAGRLQ